MSLIFSLEKKNNTILWAKSFKEAVKTNSKSPSDEKKGSSSSSRHHHKKKIREKHKSHKHHKSSSHKSSHHREHHEKKEKESSNGSSHFLNDVEKHEDINASNDSRKNGFSHFDVAIPTDISPNYKPKPRYEPPSTSRYSNGNHSGNKVNCEEDDALTAMIAYNKSGRNRTSVFSGKKSSSFYALDEPLPTLKDMCIRILQENVDRIDECGNLDYKVLQPILERAKPDDLMRIEEYNPKLMDDTGVLWEKIVKKRFPKGIREDMETFRDLYERLIYEEKDKLDRLMGRVQNSYHSLKTNKPQMKLAYIDSVAKPPRGVKRAQEKHGTFIPVGSSLDKVKKQRISKTGNGSPGGGRISGGGDGGGNATKKSKSKVAPLMAKTFKMARGLKTGFRR